jgi:serine/threonine protein kinase
VRGASLEHVLQSASLDMDAALAIIDGIAAGLCAMHEARVAHLDIKPANIILRAGEGDGAKTPVLVDFGLAGRKLRPGCGSPHYGAPEVWSQKLADVTPTPFPADAYAFAALAYELLTGHVLVTGESMIAVVAAHIAGTAGREPLARLAAQPGLGPVAELIIGGLARDADRRLTMAKLRAGFAALAPTLRARAWPLPA